MLSKYTTLLAFVAPLVSALSIQAPENITSGGTGTIKWSVDSSDPSKFNTFTFELEHPSFNQAFGLANNVDPSLGSITIQWPIVPNEDGYTIQAVNIGNISDIFATSPDFAIGATTTSSTSSSSSSTASGSGTTSVVSRSTTSGATSNIVTSTSPTSSTTGSTGSTSAAAPFNSGSAALSDRLTTGPLGGVAAVLLTAVAGAALLAL